jgi:DNA replication protein DnaC
MEKSFCKPLIATAILDPLLHHRMGMNLKGDSYRLREKQKAGLRRKSEPSSAS